MIGSISATSSLNFTKSPCVEKIKQKFHQLNIEYQMSDKFKMVSGVVLAALGLIGFCHTWVCISAATAITFGVKVAFYTSLTIAGRYFIIESRDIYRDPTIPWPGFINTNNNCWINAFFKGQIDSPEMRKALENFPNNMVSAKDLIDAFAPNLNAFIPQFKSAPKTYDALKTAVENYEGDEKAKENLNQEFERISVVVDCLTTLKKALKTYDLAVYDPKVKAGKKIAELDTQVLREALHHVTRVIDGFLTDKDGELVPEISIEGVYQDPEIVFAILTSIFKTINDKDTPLVEVKNYRLRPDGTEAAVSKRRRLPKVTIAMPGVNSEKPLNFIESMNTIFKKEYKKADMDSDYSDEKIEFKTPPKFLTIHAGRIIPVLDNPPARGGNKGRDRASDKGDSNKSGDASSEREQIANEQAPEYYGLKNETPINFPLRFTLPGNCVGTENQQTYELVSSVRHVSMGRRAENGHYVDERIGPTGNAFTEDDREVTKLSKKEFRERLDQGYLVKYKLVT